MTRADPSAWSSPSSDPADETFGDVVEPVRVDPDEPVRAADLEAYDAVLVGEPFDAAVIGRTGARDGPGAIREALAGVKSHHFTAGPIAAVGDYGDVGTATTDLESIREGVREAAETVHESAALPVFLGGDNSLTVPNVVPLLERGAVGVVNLDAHLDVRAVRAEPTSGTPYRELLEAGLDAYACVGVRHFETSTAYADYLEKRGGTVVTAADVGRDLEGALDRARDAVSDVDVVYVSVDCDVLDAAHAPGVSAPTPGGLTPRELFWLVRELARDDRLAGVEVVECAPSLDQGGRTVDAAARVVAHALAGATSRGDRGQHGDGGGERR